MFMLRGDLRIIKQLVKLDWNDGNNAGQTLGVWSWQFDITLPSDITINISSVALHPSISSNFDIEDECVI
jgi:hypothetical protein